jgi:ABC-type multidrug transport system fused ATPase/permease subunit
MHQPSYHIELLIAGFGTLLSFIIGAFAVWDMSWFPWHMLKSESNSLAIALFLLPLIYSVGIVTDRFIDNILGSWIMPKLNLKYFPDDKYGYIRARTQIYVQSESLKSVFEYSRTRIRILRGWLFNSLLIGIASLIFIISPPTPIVGTPEEQFCKFVCGNQWSLAFTVILVTVFSLIVTFRSWYMMSEGEARNLKLQSGFLEEMMEKAKK